MANATPYQYRLDGDNVASNDAILTGRQIRADGGKQPASDFVLIEIGDQTSRSVGLEEMLELREGEIPELITFKSDRVFSLTINERGYEWGRDEISASDIRRYGEIPDEHEIVLDSANDKIIEDIDVVRLKPKGVERIRSRIPEKICITVNTRQKYTDPGKLSFEEITTIAFPDLPYGPNTAFTVSFRKGSGDAPDGTLIEGECVKLKKGMVFHVSATDKS